MENDSKHVDELNSKKDKKGNNILLILLFIILIIGSCALVYFGLNKFHF